MGKEKTKKVESKQEKEKVMRITFCPECGSNNVMKEFLPFASLVIATQGLYIDKWKCKDCGFIAPIFPQRVYDKERIRKEKKKWKK